MSFVSPQWNIKVEGKQNSLLSTGQVINCFVIPPNTKVEKKKKNAKKSLV